eukprot:654574-Rhodomonas_salina.1
MSGTDTAYRATRCPVLRKGFTTTRKREEDMEAAGKTPLTRARYLIRPPLPQKANSALSFRGGGRILDEDLAAKIAELLAQNEAIVEQVTCRPKIQNSKFRREIKRNIPKAPYSLYENVRTCSGTAWAI